MQEQTRALVLETSDSNFARKKAGFRQLITIHKLLVQIIHARLRRSPPWPSDPPGACPSSGAVSNKVVTKFLPPRVEAVVWAVRPQQRGLLEAPRCPW